MKINCTHWDGRFERLKRVPLYFQEECVLVSVLYVQSVSAFHLPHAQIKLTVVLNGVKDWKVYRELCTAREERRRHGGTQGRKRRERESIIISWKQTGKAVRVLQRRFHSNRTGQYNDIILSEICISYMAFLYSSSFICLYPLSPFINDTEY